MKVAREINPDGLMHAAAACEGRLASVSTTGVATPRPRRSNNRRVGAAEGDAASGASPGGVSVCGEVMSGNP